MDYRSLSTLELVDALKVAPHNWKELADELASRAPDSEATVELMAAYDRGMLIPWLAAAALGRVGGRGAYDTVRRILRSDSPALCEKYHAAIAMVRIAGPEAEPELVRFLEMDRSPGVRLGAACGLGHLGEDISAAGIEALIEATCARRVRLRTGALVLAALPVGAGRCIQLLDSAGEMERHLGISVIYAAYAHGDWTRPYVRELLDSEELKAVLRRIPLSREVSGRDVVGRLETWALPNRIDPAAVAAMSSLEIVRAVRNREQRCHFKVLGAELASRPSDPDALTAMIEDYEAGKVEPWLATFFLGCMGDERGYEVVREILLSGKDSDYSGTAMARMGHSRCEQDLTEILRTGRTMPIRRGAAYGLQAIGSENAVQVILEAGRDGTLTCRIAGWILSDLPVEEETLVDLLDSDSERDHNLARVLLYARIQQSRGMSADAQRMRAWLARCRTLPASLRRVLVDSEGKPKATRWLELGQWIAEECAHVWYDVGALGVEAPTDEQLAIIEGPLGMTRKGLERMAAGQDLPGGFRWLADWELSRIQDATIIVPEESSDDWEDRPFPPSDPRRDE